MSITKPDPWLVRTRISRETGIPVTVGRADILGLDDGDGEMAWYTICEKHHWAIGHSTKSLARDHASQPTGWCEVCSGIYSWCETHDEPTDSCRGQHKNEEQSDVS